MSSRLRSHVLVIFLGWPLYTLVSSAAEATRIPYYSVSWFQSLVLGVAGLLLLLPEVILAAAACALICYVVFSRWGRERPSVRLSALEPIVLFAAVFWGAATWYPTFLSSIVLKPVAAWPFWIVDALLLGVIVLGAAALGRPGRRFTLAAALLGLGLAAPLPALIGEWRSGSKSEPPAIVVLGLDSVSQADDLSHLHDWTRRQQGTWYTKAVAPGLLTNAVWASVISLRSVAEHGIFHTFQSFASAQARFLELARQQGYHSVSFFSDQLTCAIGSQAGFDEDRSGPIGWRQLALPIVQNSSVLLTLWKPLATGRGFSAAPPNQAGTYTYSLRRDLREILRAGRPGRRVLAAGHLTYLHLPSYPRTLDLSTAELRRVLTAPAGSIRDRSFDWQDVDDDRDPVPLRPWKLRNLQVTLTEEIAASGILDAGGKVIVFSDHGDRVGITDDTFSDPRFHHVLLATFNIAARSPDTPMSLIDVAWLLDLRDMRAVERPAVDFVLAPPELWPHLVESARLTWSGEVVLNPTLLSRIQSNMKRHYPWSDAEH